jgi:hypothetical protein
MQKKKNSFWNDQWIVGIGTATLGVFLLRFIDSIAKTNILIGVWNFIKFPFTYIGSYLQTKFIIPIWGIVIISLSGIAFLILVRWIISLLKINNGNLESSELPPDFLKYRFDTFEGLLYKWEYEKLYSGQYTIINFNAFCLTDNCLLLHHRCPICKNYFPQIKGEEELRILIQHRVENKLYNI